MIRKGVVGRTKGERREDLGWQGKSPCKGSFALLFFQHPPYYFCYFKNSFLLAWIFIIEKLYPTCHAHPSDSGSFL